MAAITEITENWSAGVTLTEDEVWQAQDGKIKISTKASPDPDDGIELWGSRKDAISISSGKTVKYMRVKGTNAPCKLTREAV